jgi:hypothetical protein
VRVLRQQWPHVRVDAWDIRPVGNELEESGAEGIVPSLDALALERWPAAGAVITNPPFRHADEFIVRALAAASYVAMLLPFQRLGDGHSEFFSYVGLPYLYILPERPAFVATNRCVNKCGWTLHLAPQDPQRFKSCPQCGAKAVRGTQDVNCYAWYTWGPQPARSALPGGYEYLASTPLAERRAG